MGPREQKYRNTAPQITSGFFKPFLNCYTYGPHVFPFSDVSKFAILKLYAALQNQF